MTDRVRLTLEADWIRRALAAPDLSEVERERLEARLHEINRKLTEALP